ncbi:MAG: hypothetical protein M9964_05850 [Solirubrobacterales bacterium]|nr:hypothetical protein [Solirubrobacterales bacterium]
MPHPTCRSRVNNRVYAYTVVGKDSLPWGRITGQKSITGTGPNQGR